MKFGFGMLIDVICVTQYEVKLNFPSLLSMMSESAQYLKGQNLSFQFI